MFILNNMKTTTKINQKSRQRERAARAAEGPAQNPLLVVIVCQCYTNERCRETIKPIMKSLTQPPTTGLLALTHEAAPRSREWNLGRAIFTETVHTASSDVVETLLPLLPALDQGANR